MPAAGTPVASTITSISGHAITASASSVTWARPVFSASASDLAENCIRRPAGGAELFLRARDVEVGDADQVHPVRQPRLRQEHGAELAGADQADCHRPASGLPFEQQGVEVHRKPLGRSHISDT